MRRRNPYAGADVHTRKARAAGYPARSVFKLEEIDKRCRIFRPGQAVLDLGAAPGSWTLYAAKRVGRSGSVVAVDLKPITELLPESVLALAGDALDGSLALLAERGPYDVVLSDMAPSTVGVGSVDQALSAELCRGALDLAARHGRRGSCFVAKLFMSEDFQAIKRAVAEQYAECRVIRPTVTRRQSSELFFVGLGRREGV